MTEEAWRLHAVVGGRVQGVGFRAHTQWQAAGLGLSGYVKNLRDGRVEVMAEGPREDLERLERFLRAGPPGASVAQVEIEWLPGEGVLRAFTVHF